MRSPVAKAPQRRFDWPQLLAEHPERLAGYRQASEQVVERLAASASEQKDVTDRGPDEPVQID